ncbi:glycoside hydrolase family 73 protein [Burkholderia plantarii]|uniref:glycoside hydrolase family 73 protein n=1 Tax=Burkholderia plantarii TaxID=41899 RepID=UPI00272C9F09|nr:glucosaminidase domain-containing protein [Burkholderia plantarii]
MAGRLRGNDMKPDDFIAAIAPAAQASAKVTRIPASFTVAQAALESSWGALAPGHNLFGIKADASWHGPVVMENTHEHLQGRDVAIIDAFRAYPDWLGSIADHAQFLTSNPRYRSAFAYTSGATFAKAIAEAGYATDPNYAAKLISIIKSHNLSALDG